MPFQRENTHGKGRPPAGKSLTEALRVALSEKLPDGRTVNRAIADVLAKRAMEGDIAAIREVWDRTEGKVGLKVSAEDDQPRPLVFNILPQDEKLL